MPGQTDIRLSLIIPVYNRPDEVAELLESLCRQSVSDFEVIIAEDGSSVRCDHVVKQYENRLRITYFDTPNRGPGPTRNAAFARMTGNYGVFLDSDCIIPPDYVSAVLNRLNSDYVDAFGGPDRAADSFTPVQKAINYSMTSFLTTGGIRGGGEKLDRFFPRSFNMGMSQDVFVRTGGFSPMRFGEDIDLSIRMIREGFRTALIPEAWVYHKRRTRFRQFFKQIYNSGIARINLEYRHSGTLKAVHALPAAFVLGTLCCVLGAALIHPGCLASTGVHVVLLFFDALLRTMRADVAILAVVASYIQLFAYGTGFLHAFIARRIFGRGEFAAFQKKFYS
jgi:glycosyltransferase involved in cell wall biosynthesis